MRIIVLMTLVLFFTACQQGNNKKEQATDNRSSVELKEEVLNIGKMHCEMCVASVEKGLKSVEGVEFAKVNLEDSTAVVRYDETKADINTFKEVVEKRGYVLKDSDL